VIRGAITSTGGSVTVQPNQNTKFTVKVSIEWFTAGSQAGALTKTREYLSIAGEGITNVEMGSEVNAGQATDVCYYVEAEYSWTTAGKPVAGTTYTVTIQYQAYY
jgi:hypothetical protein